MAIPGQQNINIGAPNDPVGSDSLYTAFTKTQSNFEQLFSSASPITTIAGGNGINVNSVTSSAYTITNTGVTKLIAGTNINITNNVGVSSNVGELIISATGGGGGGGGGGTVTSVGVVSSSLDIFGGPITISGNIQINLPDQSFTPGFYTNPTMTVDSKGRITSIANGSGGNGGGGNVSSVGIVGGFGIGVSGSPITSSGVISIDNTGVTKITAGTGIFVNQSNGNVTISSISSGTVTSIGVLSNSLSVTGGPITTSGSINIELPNVVPNATYAVSAGSANSATIATSATSAGFATNAGTANTANSAGTAAFANSAAFANTATTANTATFATSAGSANTATTANTATFATSAGSANTATSATNATTANTATAANTAITVTSSIQSNITTVGTLTSLNVSGNVSFTGSRVALGNVSVVRITGGTSGQVLSTDGSGNLSWITQSGGSGNATPGGANTQIQFNDAGVFGANANLTFNKTTSSLTVGGNVSAGNISAGNATFTGSNVTLGSVGSVRITGGSAGQVLSTNGSGTLSWITPSGGGGNATPSGANTQIQFNDAGVFGANANLTFNKTTSALTVGGNITASAVVTTGTGVSTITSSGDILLNCFGGAGQVNSTGNIRASAGANGGGFVIGRIVSNSTAPVSASSTGVAGQIAFDSNYVYICVAANTWKRAAISTF